MTQMSTDRDEEGNSGSYPSRSISVFICVIRGSISSVEQTPLHHFAGLVELRLPGDLRPAGRQAVADLLQRVAGHVRALVASAGDPRHRVVAVPRGLAL